MTNSAEALVPATQTRELLAAAFEGSKLVDASSILESQRLTKTDYEIDKLRIASEISCIGMEAFERLVHVGISGVELVAEVEREIMARGTRYHGTLRVRAYTQVAVGPEDSALGYSPNEISTLRRLEEGTSLCLNSE